MKHRAVRSTYAMQLLQDDAICKIFDITMRELAIILYGWQGHLDKVGLIWDLYFNIPPYPDGVRVWTEEKIAAALGITLELVQYFIDNYHEQIQRQMEGDAQTGEYSSY